MLSIWRKRQRIKCKTSTFRMSEFSSRSRSAWTEAAACPPGSCHVHRWCGSVGMPGQQVWVSSPGSWPAGRVVWRVGCFRGGPHSRTRPLYVILREPRARARESVIRGVPFVLYNCMSVCSADHSRANVNNSIVFMAMWRQQPASARGANTGCAFFRLVPVCVSMAVSGRGRK